MATKAKKQEGTDYRSRITKTTSELEAEQVDLRIEEADLNFQQGILSIKGQMLTAEGDIKKKQSLVNNALQNLENAKAARPESLVQSLVDAKTNLKQAQIDLEAAQTAFDDVKDIYDFLVETKAELFK